MSNDEIKKKKLKKPRGRRISKLDFVNGSKKSLKNNEIDYFDDRALGKIYSRLTSYVEMRTKENAELLSFDISQLKEQVVNKIDEIFNPIIERKKSLIEDVKKKCKKDYKEMIKTKIPNYELKKCCVCQRSEVSTTLSKSKCEHYTCHDCVKNLEFLIEEQIEDHHGIFSICKLAYKCPVCRCIQKRDIKHQFEYDEEMTTEGPYVIPSSIPFPQTARTMRNNYQFEVPYLYQ